MMPALLAAVALAATAPAPTLTDDQLVAKATSVFANKEGPADTLLGMHNGAKVVVLIACGDVCPAYTVRVIHYDKSEKKSCAQLGGKDMSVIVPHGIAAGPESFCIPDPLVKKDLWQDHPYHGMPNG
jgi:hypothetical protein